MYEVDILITGSSRPQLLPFCIESFFKMIHFEGKMNVYFHEDFVFPDKSKEVLKYLDMNNIKYEFHNPAIGLGKSMDFMFNNHIKLKYMFYLQEDWEFERPVDLNQLIYVMEHNENVNFIGLNKIKNTGSLNGAPQPEYQFDGVDMILYHGWSFMPGLWNMDFAKKHWRVREVRPEGYFTNAFGDHETRQDCEYCKKHIGAYMLGKTGDWRYIRHLGNDWRMAKWRLENGLPGGVHDASRMDDPYRAPWLGKLPYRPIQHSTINEELLNKELKESPIEFTNQKKILIVPDIKGWSTDSMANGIISSLRKENVVFIKKYADDLILDDFDIYDIIYVMIPGYIPENIPKELHHKIRTTFHGGPATEGQADQIVNLKQTTCKISYVSSEVKNRIKDYDLNNNDLMFTPHGVNTTKFNNNNINQIKTFGYAGHARYLLNDDNQKNHRRGHWIIDAWNELKFDLKIAGGMVDHTEHVDNFNTIYPDIDCKAYDRKSMTDYYKYIDVYLIPDKHAGGPMPALEAGAMDIPLITTNCGLLGDIFIDRKHGILINTYDEFKNAIKWMIDNPDESIEMGKQWGQTVRNNRSWDSIKNYWIQFLLK